MVDEKCHTSLDSARWEWSLECRALRLALLWVRMKRGTSGPVSVTRNLQSQIIWEKQKQSSLKIYISFKKITESNEQIDPK